MADREDCVWCRTNDHPARDSASANEVEVDSLFEGDVKATDPVEQVTSEHDCIPVWKIAAKDFEKAARRRKIALRPLEYWSRYKAWTETHRSPREESCFGPRLERTSCGLKEARQESVVITQNIEVGRTDSFDSKLEIVPGTNVGRVAIV